MKKIFTALMALCFCWQTNPLHAQPENAILFDNLDDFINAPSASSLIAGSSAISMTFWVLPLNTAPAYPDYDGFAGFRNNGDADFYILQLSANGVEARFRNSAGINYDVTFGGFQTGTPQHMALTYDGSTLTLYHNGVFAGSTAASGTIANTFENFYIGMLPWTGANFYTNGRIDEVSLWSKSLSAAEVNCIFEGAINPNDNGLQLYYKFNQGISAGNNVSITALTDAAGNINGTFNNLALNGNVSNFVNGVLTGNSASITDSICAGGNYIFGSQTLTAPGVYFESFSGPGGCDSVVTLTLIQSASGINSSVIQNGITLSAQQAGASYQWIDCLNGNTPIPGDTGQTFTATTNGQYAVVLQLNGCTDTSACFNITSVGISETTSGDLMIAASNPFTQEITIKNLSRFQDYDFIITDVSGKVLSSNQVQRNQSVKIATGTWSPGIYLLTQKQGHFREKLIKIN
jgi:hypothetical protein